MADNTLTIWGAIAAGAGALALKYVSDFLAGDFKRWRDGSALAAALAGELSSYEPAWPKLRQLIGSIKATADAERTDELAFRPMDTPKDRVFDAVVANLGLLEAPRVRALVYVYGNLGAARLSFVMIMQHGPTMTAKEISLRSQASLDALERTMAVGIPLIADLEERACEGFWRWWWRGFRSEKVAAIQLPAL